MAGPPPNLARIARMPDQLNKSPMHFAHNARELIKGPNLEGGDERRRREILASTVLPRWLQRCGPGCAELWNRTLAPATGVEARPR